MVQPRNAYVSAPSIDVGTDDSMTLVRRKVAERGMFALFTDEAGGFSVRAGLREALVDESEADDEQPERPPLCLSVRLDPAGPGVDGELVYFTDVDGVRQLCRALEALLAAAERRRIVPRVAR